MFKTKQIQKERNEKKTENICTAHEIFANNRKSHNDKLKGGRQRARVSHNVRIFVFFFCFYLQTSANW